MKGKKGSELNENYFLNWTLGRDKDILHLMAYSLPDTEDLQGHKIVMPHYFHYFSTDKKSNAFYWENPQCEL